LQAFQGAVHGQQLALKCSHLCRFSERELVVEGPEAGVDGSENGLASRFELGVACLSRRAHR
jgi:hypothetical protein